MLCWLKLDTCSTFHSSSLWLLNHLHAPRHFEKANSFLFPFLCCFLLSPAVRCCCLLLPALVPADCTCLEVLNPECWARGQGPGCAFPFINWRVSCLLTWHFSVMSSMSSQRIADSLEVHLGRFDNYRVTILGWPVSWNRVFREVWGMLIGCVLFFPLSLCLCVCVCLLPVCLFFPLVVLVCALVF